MVTINVNDLEDGEIVTVGNKLYGKCALCGQLVCLNKTFFGDLHICVDRAKIIARQKHLEKYGDKEEVK